MSEPEIGHARPLLYPDSRPEPAARRAANPSIERKRDAHLHPDITSSDALRGVLRRKKPVKVSESTPTGLKRLKTKNTASYDCNAKWERLYLALPNLYTSANSFRKKNSSTLPTLVEMAGIEPASEKGLPRLSTSVAFVLEFPLPPAQKQARGFGSP